MPLDALPPADARDDADAAPPPARRASLLLAAPVPHAALVDALGAAGHRVARVSQAEAAVERALVEDFDLVLLDGALGDIGAVAAADILRRLGRAARLVLLGPPPEGAGAWFDEALPAEPDPASVAAVVDRAVRAADQAFASSQAGLLAEAVEALRPGFVAGLPQALAAVAQAVARRDAPALRSACHRLRGSAATFGHEALAAAAADVERALQQGLEATAFAAAGELADRGTKGITS